MLNWKRLIQSVAELDRLLTDHGADVLSSGYSTVSSPLMCQTVSRLLKKENWHNRLCVCVFQLTWMPKRLEICPHCLMWEELWVCAVCVCSSVPVDLQPHCLAMLGDKIDVPKLETVFVFNIIFRFVKMKPCSLQSKRTEGHFPVDMHTVHTQKESLPAGLQTECRFKIYSASLFRPGSFVHALHVCGFWSVIINPDRDQLSGFMKQCTTWSPWSIMMINDWMCLSVV